jgi:pimeloyl-ACP methyl ester carboxylesterase
MEKSAREHLNHRAKLEGFNNPVMVLHAEHDHLVPRDNADRLAAWARADLRIFPEGDHNSILAHNGPTILSAVGDLVASL